MARNKTYFILTMLVDGSLDGTAICSTEKKAKKVAQECCDEFYLSDEGGEKHTLMWKTNGQGWKATVHEVHEFLVGPAMMN